MNDYDLLTNALKQGLDLPGYTYEELEPIRDLIGLLEEQLAEEDPGFDRDKFLKACGIAAQTL